MAAVGFVLLTVGAMLVYAGMTGESLPGAVRDVIKADGKASSRPAQVTATDTARDAAAVNRPRQP